MEMNLPEICLGLFSEASGRPLQPTSAVDFQVAQSCPALPAKETVPSEGSEPLARPLCPQRVCIELYE